MTAFINAIPLPLQNTPCLPARTLRPATARTAMVAQATDNKTHTTPDPALLTSPPPLFGRVITAMVTPFKRDGAEVDYALAQQMATHLVSNGSDALVIAGTTGESPTLTWSEQYELFNVVRDAVGDRAKVIAGAGSNSTSEAVDATHRAKKIGLDGTLQVAPYYNKPPQEGLYQHFKAVSEAEPTLPLMLYNIPSRTGINMSPDIITRLSLLDNVVAIKQATDNMDEFVAIRKATASDFHIYSGDDALTLPFLALGATGVVSVASHFIGNQLQQMVNNYVNGDVAAATRIHLHYSKLFSELFCMTNPIPTKTALRLQGWPVGGPRLPLVDATPEVEEMLSKLLTELSLL